MLFEVRVPTELLESYTKFAEACVETNKNLYKNRNQRNVDKITEDILNGKMGEYGAYEFLRSRNMKPDDLPDIKIYAKRNKSFGADLNFGNVPVHVKCQSEESATKYGMSWTFQYGGRTDTGNKKRNHHDPIIENPSGVIIFCTVGSVDRGRLPRVWVQAALPTTLCIPELLELPKLDYLKDFKRVVYYETLKKKHPSLCDLSTLLLTSQPPEVLSRVK